jgi:hypothetical protein
MASTLCLDPVLDLKAAQPLKAALTEHRGASVAARRAWSEEGHDLTIEPRSAAFSAAAALFAAEDHLGLKVDKDGAVP